MEWVFLVPTLTLNLYLLHKTLLISSLATLDLIPTGEGRMDILDNLQGTLGETLGKALGEMLELG